MESQGRTEGEGRWLLNRKRRATEGFFKRDVHADPMRRGEVVVLEGC